MPEIKIKIFKVNNNRKTENEKFRLHNKNWTQSASWHVNTTKKNYSTNFVLFIPVFFIWKWFTKCCIAFLLPRCNLTPYCNAATSVYLALFHSCFKNHLCMYACEYVFLTLISIYICIVVLYALHMNFIALRIKKLYWQHCKPKLPDIFLQ